MNLSKNKIDIIPIKNGSDIGIIQNLKVVTNNVILHYDNEFKSELLDKHEFRGTLYRWEVTANTILKAS